MNRFWSAATSSNFNSNQSNQSESADAFTGFMLPWWRDNPTWGTRQKMKPGARRALTPLEPSNTRLTLILSWARRPTGWTQGQELGRFRLERDSSRRWVRQGGEVRTTGRGRGVWLWILVTQCQIFFSYSSKCSYRETNWRWSFKKRTHLGGHVIFFLSLSPRTFTCSRSHSSRRLSGESSFPADVTASCDLIRPTFLCQTVKPPLLPIVVLHIKQRCSEFCSQTVQRKQWRCWISWEILWMRVFQFQVSLGTKGEASIAEPADLCL